MTYFHWKYNQLSSAQRLFTVLFGMGRSGTTPVWPPGKGLSHPAEAEQQNLCKQKQASRAHDMHSRFKSGTELAEKQATRL